MNAFTNSERYDMLECFSLCRRNDEMAKEMYLNKYPERRQPGKSIFRRLKNNLINNGSFVKLKRDKRANEEKENLVIQSVIETPRTSLRRIYDITGVSRSTASDILKRNKFHPYRERPCQGLQDGDQARRLELCHWFLEECNLNPNFPSKVLWSDESRFTNCGMFNRRNTVFWSDINPHLSHEVRHQVKWGFNVWIGIIDTHVIGPYFYDENLNSERYLNLLQTFVADRIMDLPLATRQNMYFQQDGAPPHNARIVTDYLNNEYHNRWIGNQGPVRWPARSPDITPMDFFVWGYLKDIVYATSHENADALRLAVVEAVNSITPEMISQSCEAVSR